jgi:hypothetical protein
MCGSLSGLKAGLLRTAPMIPAEIYEHMKSLELSLRFEELETLNYKKPKSMNKERPQT